MKDSMLRFNLFQDEPPQGQRLIMVVLIENKLAILPDTMEGKRAFQAFLAKSKDLIIAPPGSGKIKPEIDDDNLTCTFEPTQK